MASNKLEKEKQKLVNEKCLSILNDLLRDEDNKYCVDCDAKGPRWASWNLGIFLCIRCAGIHRNLGVHISRVKSVNLDAWTPEQIACLQNMGNSKARAVYEANLPDNFRRPQTDSSLEAFVRAKYEQKKYIAKEWVEPPPPKPAFDIEEELRKEKERKRNKNKPLQSQNNIEVQSNSLPRPNSSPAGTVINADKIPQEVMKRGEVGKNNTSDLLGLEMSSTSDSKADDDSFGIFVSSVSAIDTTDNVTNNKNEPKTDEESDFFNQKAPTDEKKVMSKESILSLYGSASQQQPQQSILVGPQTTPFNASNQSLFMGQFAPNPQVMPSQPQNGMFVPQNTAISGIQTSLGQQPTNLMSQNSIFPLTTNPFLANNSSNTSSFGQQTVTQLPQHLASLQLNSTPFPNPITGTNQMPNNNWFPNGQINSGGLPFPPSGVINPFMSNAPPLIPAGVPLANNFSGVGSNTGPMFSAPDANSQWAFNSNASLSQQSGVMASNNLWQ